MPTKFFKTIFFLVVIIFLGYLLLPNYNFPVPPPNSPQSTEPGDTETPLRRAYFTDYTREEVMDWYKTQLDKSTFLNIPLPTYRLNYPPEDAKTIIRDQTRTTFLEEIVHPFRESVYVNGFEPSPTGQDRIIINGRHFRQKIIIKYVPSSPLVRILVFSGIILFSITLFNAYNKTLIDMKGKKIKV